MLGQKLRQKTTTSALGMSKGVSGARLAVLYATKFGKQHCSFGLGGCEICALYAHSCFVQSMCVEQAQLHSKLPATECCP